MARVVRRWVSNVVAALGRTPLGGRVPRSLSGATIRRDAGGRDRLDHLLFCQPGRTPRHTALTWEIDERAHAVRVDGRHRHVGVLCLGRLR